MIAKPSVSRAAFRGLFALYAAEAHHNHNSEGENRLLKQLGSSEHMPDGLLELWSGRTEPLSPEIVGSVLSQVAQEVISGVAPYDHASDFPHRLLQEIDRRVY